MYIEYVRDQREGSEYGGLYAYPVGIRRRLTGYEVSEFKPTWLVRISDMQVVPGSSVTGHYWALSYSWNQSGELIHKGGEDYDRVDEGKHKITKFRDIPGYTIKRNIVTNTDFDPKTASTTSVTFECLVQQICKDVGIDYIWFDQMCINQDDHDAKMQEIKQMHNIYKNALCTLALVPELRWIGEDSWGSGKTNIEIVPNSQWCKRMWTLEEAYLSENILFLGRDVHIWADVNLIWLASTKWATSIPKISNEKWMACTALWYARNRTSSKAHDRIFALANIFPELMDGIIFSYKQPFLDLMIRFYTTMAEKDISILLFGAPLDPEPENEITPVRQKEASLLPSWTGAMGSYVPQFVLDDEFDIVPPDYTITGDCMRLMSSFITACIEDTDAVEKPDDFDNPDMYETISFRGNVVKAKDCTDGRRGEGRMFTENGLPILLLPYDWDVGFSDNGSSDLVFVSTTSESHSLYSSETFGHGLKVTHILPLSVEDITAVNTLRKPTFYDGFLSLTEECSKCIILLEPAFHLSGTTVGEYYTVYPVIRQEKSCYRSIGTFYVRNISIISNVQPKQTFHIK